MNFTLGYGASAFSSDVITRWGNVCTELVHDQGLLHPQMAHLGRLCFTHGHLSREILGFLEEVVSRRDASSEIENAIAISFLEWPDLERLGSHTVVPEVVTSKCVINGSAAGTASI